MAAGVSVGDKIERITEVCKIMDKAEEKTYCLNCGADYIPGAPGKCKCGKNTYTAYLLNGVELDPSIMISNPDPVNHPSHYAETVPGVECIDVTKHFSFCRGNAIKYLWRAGKKDAAKTVEDLRKAIWYIEKEIETLGGSK